MAYVTIPARLARLREKSARERMAKSGKSLEEIKFVELMRRAKRELEYEIADAEKKLTLINNVITIYER